MPELELLATRRLDRAHDRLAREVHLAIDATHHVARMQMGAELGGGAADAPKRRDAVVVGEVKAQFIRCIDRHVDLERLCGPTCCCLD